MDRREFLTRSAFTGGLFLSPLTISGQSNTKSLEATATTPAQIRVLMTEANGKPLVKERASTLCIRDLAGDPLPQQIIRAEGRARVELPKEPVQLSLRLNVPGFGEVYCWADNNGQGYTRPGNYDFAQDAAATRARRVKEGATAARQMGITLDRQTQAYLTNSAQPITNTRTAYAALAAGLHAGERLTLAMARHRIEQLEKPRHEFLFGGLIAPYAQLGEPFEQAIKNRFNFATASWYVWGPEQPVDARIDYARMDGAINWCLERGIEPKGFGYCYMSRGATSEWIRDWPFEKILPEYQRIVRQTMRRYDGRIKYAEIINEAHDKANLWKLSHPQIVEITRVVCAAAREGSPSVKRLINNCCMWAEYARNTNADGSRRWSPYRYINDCIAGGVDFDVLGLQLYYPSVDLFEIERMLDRFTKFNKPIHITEISTASAPGADPNSMRPNSISPPWHGPWSEATQADWLEAIYTIVYSKPQFEAITWWDITDRPGHFWPHGGLLHADLKPKQAYHRLGKLQQRWGVGPASQKSRR